MGSSPLSEYMAWIFDYYFFFFVKWTSSMIYTHVQLGIICGCTGCLGVRIATLEGDVL